MIKPNTQMAIRDVCDMSMFLLPGLALAAFIDYANVTNLALTSDSVSATGGHGAPKKVTFDNPGDHTFNIETQVYTPLLISLVTGSKLEDSAEFLRRKILAVESGSITIDEEATPGTVAVYEIGADGSEAQDITATIGSGKTTIAFAGTAPDEGARFVVYWFVSKATGILRIPITNRAMPRTYKCVGSASWKGTDDVIYAGQLTLHRIKPRKELTLNMSNSGDPSTMTIPFDVLETDMGEMVDLVYNEEE